MLKCSPEAFAKCPTHQYCGNSAADCDFTEGSDCDKFNQQIASQPVHSCNMCTNATTVEAFEVSDEKLKTAIKLLIKQYERSKASAFVNDPIAHALYYTWKQVDERNDNND